MASEYKLTWRTEQGGRWRKKYKGREYYFPRLPGETKEASHRRCWAAWVAKKAEIDRIQSEDEPWRRKLNVLIARTKRQLAELQANDTPQNRRRWEFCHGQLAVYQQYLEHGIDTLSEGENPDDPTDFIAGNIFQSDRPEPPPWEACGPAVVKDETVAANIKRYLDRKGAQANRGERSAGRVEVLRVGLEAFAANVGADLPLTSVTGATLTRYRDALERLVDAGTLRPHSARDRLQAVKQFVRWAWEEERMGLPRVLESRTFSIGVPTETVRTFTDFEVRRLIEAATGRTRLYLLLMLNCGMTQGDIAEIRHDEVDWNTSRLTRKRSKTRKARNARNVPEVSYPLWRETFCLLKDYRSDHPTLVLLNQKNKPLKSEILVNGRAKKVDNVRSAFNRLLLRLIKDPISPMAIGKPAKLLRKTSATKLGDHPEFGRFAQHFLGHAPSTVADRFYVRPTVAQFDAAVGWLGKQFLSVCDHSELSHELESRSPGGAPTRLLAANGMS